MATTTRTGTATIITTATAATRTHEPRHPQAAARRRARHDGAGGRHRLQRPHELSPSGHGAHPHQFGTLRAQLADRGRHHRHRPRRQAGGRRGSPADGVSSSYRDVAPPGRRECRGGYPAALVQALRHGGRGRPGGDHAGGGDGADPVLRQDGLDQPQGSRRGARGGAGRAPRGDAQVARRGGRRRRYPGSVRARDLPRGDRAPPISRAGDRHALRARRRGSGDDRRQPSPSQPVQEGMGLPPCEAGPTVNCRIPMQTDVLHKGTTPLDAAASFSGERAPFEWGWVVIALCVALTVYLAVIPLGFLLWQSFFTPQTAEKAAQFTFSNYAEAYGSTETLRLLRNSVLFAIGTSTFSFVVGTLLAWMNERTNTPFKGLFFALSIIPLIIPGILFTVAWILLASPKIGILNLVLRTWFGIDEAPFDIYSLWGMIWVDGLHYSPMAFLLMSAAFRSMDPALEESHGRV